MPIDLDQGVRVQRRKDRGEISFDEIAQIPASDIARAHKQQLPGPAVQEVREIKAVSFEITTRCSLAEIALSTPSFERFPAGSIWVCLASCPCAESNWQSERGRWASTTNFTKGRDAGSCR